MSYTRMQGQLLPEGWLKEFLRRDKEGITGNLDKLFRDCAEDVFGADKVTHEEDGYWSSWWAGETHGNWIEAYVRLAFLTGEEELVSRARAIVENILAHQGEDGYIGIYVEGARYIVTKRFGELWAQSRAMRTPLSAYTISSSAVTALSLSVEMTAPQKPLSDARPFAPAPRAMYGTPYFCRTRTAFTAAPTLCGRRHSGALPPMPIVVCAAKENSLSATHPFACSATSEKISPIFISPIFYYKRAVFTNLYEIISQIFCAVFVPL